MAAALHGSRKSLVGGIVKEAIGKMVLNFHSQPEEILVAIGPHIRKCHYWLEKQTYQNLKNTKFKKYFISKNKKIYNGFIKKAAESIKKGEILVCPTDTVYGLIADATNKKAVERLFKIKKRPPKKPIPIFVKDTGMAKKLAQIDKKQGKFLKESWPGKVTVVLKRKKSKIKVYGVDSKTIALRIPNYRFLNILLEKLNRPLTGTSANISGKPASTKIKEIISQFKNQRYQPDLIIDTGNLPKNRPSTVIDLTAEKPKILRK